MAIENTYLLGKNIQLGCGFDLNAEAPLDSRQTVPSYAGLAALIYSNAAYEGMIVYDEETQKTYQAQKCAGYKFEGVDKTYYIEFREFGINESELKDLIASETTAAMEFKGATATLPENPAKGDMYKVAGENINIKIDDVDAKLGDSIVYDGTKWFLIPSGDDIEDTWRPVDGVNNDATLKFVDGDKTVAAVAADGTIKYNHATVAAPADVTAEGDEKTRTYITAVETDGYGHITGYKTATENVEDTNTTYEFEGQAEESSVYFQVTSSEEGASAEVIYLDAYSKNETNAELVKKLDKSVYDAYIDGKEMSDAELKKYAEDYTDTLRDNLMGAGDNDHLVVAEAAEAQKATKDGNGNVISDTYALKSDVDTLKGDDTVSGSVAKSIKDATEEIRRNLIDGDQEWSVAKANVANSATKATQDGDGNVISTTYAKDAEFQPVKENVNGMVQSVETNTRDIETLKGADTVDGSVAKSIKDAIERVQSLLVNGDDEWIVNEASLAGEATKATKDGDGNVISETYVVKEDGKGLSANDFTDELKGQYDDAYAHSQAAHAPANAQENSIEAVRVNNEVVEIKNKCVYITVPTGALAGKDKVAKTDLADDLKTELEGKADQATTLAGYGIGDAYTKTEIEALLTWGEF